MTAPVGAGAVVREMGTTPPEPARRECPTPVGAAKGLLSDRVVTVIDDVRLVATPLARVRVG